MFYKYKKLYTFRFMKEQLKIIYARILGIFTAKDREKVVDFLINSTKYVNIIPFLMFSTIYFLVLLIISDSLNRNIILAGVISIVLSVLYTVFKYRESKLNDMKEELSLILNHINPKQSSAFLIKYLCIDLFKNVIFYAALPYIITGTLLLAITEFNVYLFLILLGYFALSFSLTLCILITKIIIRNQIIFDLFMSLVLISVATYLYTVIPFPENIENIIINNSANLEVKEPTLIAHAVWVSCFIISTIITCLCILKIDSEQFFKVFFYKEKI
ncbi:hypothetical protein JCM21714_2898 [Gracilibacillus boraciitolerans JCM 21714]|uniref:Uncharacterized protein n=1 Tax=Gracilibacillus boraciitolerans JCM 21714 TaxID=1298598 RepID=W4VLU0_9BACI|nr:hypothetical protein [Gracilibacillus boraciitolerans]GAE93793.1 hypothetical protein JCM21714_2898 [Gracilibacillus boraciitolerans JCM 21714]